MGNHVMMLNLKKTKFVPESVIVITGASSGMGKELTYRYAQRGARIVIGSRSIDVLKEIAADCNAKYPHSKVIPVKTDVTIEKECKNLIETAVKHFERIDILILNAGISAHAQFEDVPDMEIFHQLMNTNFFGYVYPTKYALPYLKEHHGQIVVMSSYSGEVGICYRSGYCASKFAVTGFFESLRMEVGDKIDITIICPITVETSFREHSLIQPPHHEVKEGDSKKQIGTSLTVNEAIETIL